MQLHVVPKTLQDMKFTIFFHVLYIYYSIYTSFTHHRYILMFPSIIIHEVYYMIDSFNCMYILELLAGSVYSAFFFEHPAGV